MIDFQMHSSYSDGSQSPTELVKEAKALGLTAIALTDHDTIDGVPEFLDAGGKAGVITIPGVEISIDTKLPNHGHMHLLGLFIDPAANALKDRLDYLLVQRNLRAEKIIQKLNALNVKVSMEELLAEAGEGAIGRPHVAKIMVRKGLTTSIQEAFDRYLKKGGPAYVDKVKFDEADAIRLVKEAGGLAILAHPHLMNYDTFAETRSKIMALKALGLDGFEVYYSGLSPELSRELIALAEEYDFAVSGGSDYHGANKDGIRMGTGKGNLQIADEVYERLKERWEKSKK